MLQRLTSLDEELYAGCGLWSRSQLEEMNDRFVAAVTAAFDQGLESPAAASATVQLGPRLNGSRLLKEQAAIGAAWKFFVDAKYEATAAEVVARVRAICPKVSAETIRVEFWKRLRGSDGAVVGLGDGPGR